MRRRIMAEEDATRARASSLSRSESVRGRCCAPLLDSPSPVACIGNHSLSPTQAGQAASSAPAKDPDMAAVRRVARKSECECVALD